MRRQFQSPLTVTVLQCKLCLLQQPLINNTYSECTVKSQATRGDPLASLYKSHGERIRAFQGESLREYEQLRAWSDAKGIAHEAENILLGVIERYLISNVIISAFWTALEYAIQLCSLCIMRRCTFYTTNSCIAHLFRSQLRTRLPYKKAYLKDKCKASEMHT